MEFSLTTRSLEAVTDKKQRRPLAAASGRYKGKKASAEFGEAVANAITQRLAVNRLSRQDFFGGLDDGPHMLDGSRFRIGNGLRDSGIHFGFGSAGGQIAFDDGQFLGFFIDQVLAA